VETEASRLSRRRPNIVDRRCRKGTSATKLNDTASGWVIEVLLAENLH